MTHACILALIWGSLWAAFLQFNRFGRWLARKRTWITVVVGVGVDLLIMRRVIPKDAWLKVVTIITFSSLSIIFRSLYNELHETLRDISAIKNSYRK